MKQHIQAISTCYAPVDMAAYNLIPQSHKLGVCQTGFAKPPCSSLPGGRWAAHGDDQHIATSNMRRMYIEDSKPPTQLQILSTLSAVPHAISFIGDRCYDRCAYLRLNSAHIRVNLDTSVQFVAGLTEHSTSNFHVPVSSSFAAEVSSRMQGALQLRFYFRHAMNSVGSLHFRFPVQPIGVAHYVKCTHKKNEIYCTGYTR